MMLMRDRSGRSGRRRGSQKPGTAIGSALTAGVSGTAGLSAGAGAVSLRGACAKAAPMPRAASTASAAAPPSLLPCPNRISALARKSGATIAPGLWRARVKWRRSAGGQVLLDFVQRQLDEILVDLGAQRALERMRIDRAQH